MGIAGGDAMETQFHQDIDVTFSLSGTTDNGLTFGAAVDIDERSAGSDPADDDGVAVFISGNFGTLTMGDTDGALDWAVTENVGNPGSIADNETGHAGYMGSFLDGAYDGQILRYDYSFGDFGFAVSTEMDDSGVRDNGMAIGLRYGMDMGGATLNLGLGYQTATYAAAGADDLTVAGIDISAITGAIGIPAGYEVEVDAIGVSANVAMTSGLTAGIAYTTYDASYIDGTGEMDHLALSLGYSMDALSVGINWGQYDGSFTVGGTPYAIDQEGWGLAAAYDLGGGAGLHLGYGSTNGGADTWSLGLAMSF
jgi:outer membrane protein OmpU